MMDLENGAVFVQTNDAGANMVEAFARDAEGTLSHVGSFPTGGRGNGTPHLPSQGSVVFDSAGRLFVVNAESDDVTVFDVRGSGLHLVDVTPSGGTSPVSVAAHSDLVYVLNRGGEGPGGVTGFRMTATGLRAIDGASAPLSSDEADGAQIAFSPAGHLLVVTERGTDRISTYAVRPAGTVDGPYAHASSGATPYGFDFAAGVLVVTEAFGGAVGAAAASSYALDRDHGIEPVSASVQNTRSEVCWAAVTQDGRYAYVTNFGDNTISSYEIGADGSIELLEAVAAATRQGEKGIRDEALSADGRFLYAIDADSGEIYGWSVAKDGQLSPIGAVNGLPLTVAGLAAA
jgi:6-phosphogluconolactonase